MTEWLTAVAPYATMFITGGILFISWQHRVVHRRIDKVGAELDEHMKEGKEVLKHMAVMERLHKDNGHKH